MRGIVLLLGVLSFFFGLGLFWVGSSLFADFRTENITGPGVDVFVLDKHPSKDGMLPLEVHVRGGSKAGLNSVSVVKFSQVIKEFRGEGVTWHGTISSGKSRGDDEITIEVPVKDVYYEDENAAEFALDAYYVCAMSSVSHYENEEQHDMVDIRVPVLGGGSGSVALFKDLFVCLLYFLLWAGFWHLILRGLEKHADNMNDFEKDAAYPALGFLLCGGILGYWIFARKIGAVIGLSDGWFVFLMMLVWFSGIVIAAWPIRKRLKAKKII